MKYQFFHSSLHFFAYEDSIVISHFGFGSMEPQYMYLHFDRASCKLTRI
jgi:hypothetical protein